MPKPDETVIMPVKGHHPYRSARRKPEPLDCRSLVNGRQFAEEILELAVVVVLF